MRFDQLYEQTIEKYIDYLTSHQRKLDKSLVFNSVMINTELLKRDFTKRQRSILVFIYNLSLSIGKERAIIPKLQDFELCGISKTKIKDELDKLIELNVISWDKDSNYFQIINPREWKAPYHQGYNDARSQALFLLNLDDAGIDVNDINNRL
ncbi:replication protein [Virgibacillus sp. M23]|uniref:replication protein n=1 Tax=Virgibacillus sp. M23 TaxID=3079030 RepID=UPI002A919681|nr:replication protein [Virgibacillus sp. M23]MDY7043627.1 replication protein [Virgibacillus sp. M23]